MPDRHTIDAALRPFGLFVSGVVTKPELLPSGAKSLALLSPDEPGFWAVFSGSEEYNDGKADPLDRWSCRVIGALADRFGAAPVFPFDGPPFAPFLQYALHSGETFSSPLGLVVHSTRGLMISYRGALALPFELAQSRKANPCTGCTARPCLSACPAQAFATGSYDVRACKDWLATPRGTTCIEGACAVRKSCPHSRHARHTAQSQFHMKAFTG